MCMYIYGCFVCIDGWGLDMDVCNVHTVYVWMDVYTFERLDGWASE